jgi:hypothetical protein
VVPVLVPVELVPVELVPVEAVPVPPVCADAYSAATCSGVRLLAKTLMSSMSPV